MSNETKVVPVEPTFQQRSAAVEQVYKRVSGSTAEAFMQEAGMAWNEFCVILYRAMISATPAPEPAPVTDFNLYTSPPVEFEQSEVERLRQRVKELEQWQREMVEIQAGSGKLDGYRELASRLGAMELRAEAAEARLAAIGGLQVHTASSSTWNEKTGRAEGGALRYVDADELETLINQPVSIPPEPPA